MTSIEKSKEDARNLNELTDHLIKLIESDDKRFSFEFCAGDTMEIYDKDYIPEANAKDLLHEAEKQLVEYGIDIIPDEFGEKETLRKAVQMIKYRNKVLDLVLRLESGEVENYAENRN